MYDRVKLRGYVSDPASVRRRLPDSTVTLLADGRRKYHCRVGDLRLTLREEGTIFIDGSLNRHAGPCAPSEVGAHAHSLISELVGEDLGGAAVTRLELFADFALDKVPALYLLLLLALPRHKQGGWPGETVKFATCKRTLSFYDKAAERGRAVDGGLLRQELTYMGGGVPKYLGRVTLGDLQEAAFRRRMAADFVRWWERVEKGAEVRVASGGRRVADALAVKMLYQQGVGAALAQLDAEMREGEITTRERSYARKRVLELARHPVFTTPSPLIEELDAAVREAASAMRA